MFNPFELAKYMTLDLGELLDLLVLHQKKLNELLANGQFGSSKYRKHRRGIIQIQNAIRVITDRANQTTYSPKKDLKEAKT